MFRGELAAIYVAEEDGGKVRQVPEARAVPGRGLAGDRYFRRPAPVKPHRQVTLIEEEAVQAIVVDYSVFVTPGELRRNLVTRGVPLNHLVGKTFAIGGVRLRGIRLCNPCRYLESLTRKGVTDALRHRGGLRAEIVEGGVLRTGDAVYAPVSLMRQQ